MTAVQSRVLALLADLAAGRTTPTPCGDVDATEPERMTDAEADRAYALDADYAAAAMFG